MVSVGKTQLVPLKYERDWKNLVLILQYQIIPIPQTNPIPIPIHIQLIL